MREQRSPRNNSRPRRIRSSSSNKSRRAKNLHGDRCIKHAAKEREALRKEFDVVRKLEEDKKKKKRNLLLAGIVTAVVVGCAVLFGSGAIGPLSQDDTRSGPAAPNFANTATVEEKPEPAPLVEEDIVEEPDVSVKVTKKIARKKVPAKKDTSTEVRKRTVEEAAVEKFKKMTAEEIAAMTARRGKKMRVVMSHRHRSTLMQPKR